MFAQSDALFTGQLVFALTALLGLVSVGVKVFGRKSHFSFVARDEFHDFRHDIAAELDALRSRLDNSFERVLRRLDERASEVLLAHDQRSQAMQDRLAELQAQIARLDERTK